MAWANCWWAACSFEPRAANTLPTASRVPPAPIMMLPTLLPCSASLVRPSSTVERASPNGPSTPDWLSRPSMDEKAPCALAAADWAWAPDCLKALPRPDRSPSTRTMTDGPAIRLSPDLGFGGPDGLGFPVHEAHHGRHHVVAQGVEGVGKTTPVVAERGHVVAGFPLVGSASDTSTSTS